MFKTARMKKFRVIFPKTAHDRVVAGLHEAGVVQLKEISELEVSRRTAGEEVFELSSLLTKFREMGGFLGRPAGKPITVKELTFEQTMKLAKRSLGQLEPKVNQLREKSLQLAQEHQSLLTKIEMLEYFQEIKFSLRYLRSTDEVHVTAGRIAEERVDELFAAADEALGQQVFSSALGAGKLRVIVVACRAQDYPKLSPVLYRYEVEVLDIPPEAGSPLAAIKDMKKQLVAVESRRQHLEKAVGKLARTKAIEVFRAMELLEIQKERIEGAGLFGHTDATTVVEGWVKTKAAADLEKTLRGATEGHYVFHASDPQRAEVEAVPVELENPRVVQDFEFVTGMYGLARYDEIDPTPFLSVTFALFFAIALADAGYGIALGLFMGSGFWLAKIFSRKLRRMMVVCAIFTVVAGLFLGGFFGFGNGLWVNPIQRPIPLLKLVIFVGIIHLLTASGLAGALKDILRRDWKSLIVNRFSAVLIIIGFSGLVFSVLGLGLFEFGINFTFPKMELFSAFNPLGPAGAIVTTFRVLFYLGLLVGLVGTALVAGDTKGRVGNPLNFIYNSIIGFIADVSSYTRLMALAIAGSVIAFSINLILGLVYAGVMPKEITPISVIVAVPLLIGLAFVFIAAHSFNIFLNSIGAFIHTMRLHFAEFFGKFYESGGETFATFKVKRRFTKIRGGD